MEQEQEQEQEVGRSFKITSGAFLDTIDCTFSQSFSSPALTVVDRQCLEDSEQKDDSSN